MYFAVNAGNKVEIYT